MRRPDRAAFENLALPLLDSAYRTAMRMTGRPAAAEDLVQETYLRAFRSFHQFQPGSNFRAWFFRILTNAYLNEARRRVREPRPFDFAEFDPAEDLVETPVFRIEDVEAIRPRLGDEAARAVDRLPPSFRVPLLLSAYEGFSYKEIAEVLGIPVGTVMSRLFRARRQLRQDLLEYARASGFLKDRKPP